MLTGFKYQVLKVFFPEDISIIDLFLDTDANQKLNNNVNKYLLMQDFMYFVWRTIVHVLETVRMRENNGFIMTVGFFLPTQAYIHFYMRNSKLDRTENCN